LHGCPDCGQTLEATAQPPRIVQQLDLEAIRFTIEEHHSHTSWCPHCQKAYTAPTFEIWAWGLGAIANHALIQIYGQAINVLTVSYALSPLLVSLCMVLPRIIDGIADPVIGHLSDNTRTRWGRRKPFLVAGALLGTLFICSIWWTNNSWSTPVQFAFLLTTGILFYISWGAYTMAWTTMGYELSDDYSERSRIAAISGIFLAITTTAIGWIYWLALRPLFHDGLIRTLSNIATAPTMSSNTAPAAAGSDSQFSMSSKPPMSLKTRRTMMSDMI
jgi:hypothetical protein